MLNKFPYKLNYGSGETGVVAAKTRDEAVTLLRQKHNAADEDCIDYVAWANNERLDIVEPGVYPD